LAFLESERMPVALSKLRETIESGKVPPMILVGGDNDFLVEHAYQQLRDAALRAIGSDAPETFAEGTPLAGVIDSFRTFSLFARPRLLILPEVTAFISKKELSSTYNKAVGDWKSAKTDRKRDSAMAKLLHVLGLVGLELEDSDAHIAEALGVETEPALVDMLDVARSTSRSATKGEGDAAILAEAATHGGAPGTTLLMKAVSISWDSPTVEAIDRAGAVVVCDLTQEQVPTVLRKIIEQVEAEADVRFEPAAVKALEKRLGVTRMLEDKYSKEIPDLRLFESQAERLATFAGAGGTVRASIVEQQVEEIAGGKRFEFASLVTEGKPVEAVGKLRDLVTQARRETSSPPEDVVYGRFLFPLADEIRQILAVQSYARLQRIDLRRGMPYNTFRSSVADDLSSYLMNNHFVDRKPHPFPLHKKFEAAARYRERDLLAALKEIARIEVARKSGGTEPNVALEVAVLGMKK
jgi:DNA polymerase III delta subunit